MFSSSVLIIAWLAYALILLPIHVSSGPPDLPGRGHLVPSKRTTAITSRSLLPEDFAPKTQVKLDYGIASYLPPSAHVVFSAHDDLPFILLEDFDHLLYDVSCGPSIEGDHIMTMSFALEEAYDEVLSAWSEWPSFTVITAHPTCNEMNERSAWRVLSISGDASQWQIKLAVEPIGMHELGHSCHVSYNAQGSHEWVPNTSALHRRQFQTAANISEISYSPDIPSRLTLFPEGSGNLTLIPSEVSQALADANLTLTCVDCTFKATYAVGIDFSVNAMNTTCIQTITNNCFVLGNVTLNFTIVDFEQTASLEVALGSEFSKALNWTFLSFPIDDFIIPGLVQIGPSLGLQVSLDLNTSGELNFTYGATAKELAGAFIAFDLVDSDGNWGPSFDSSGLGQSGVDQIPLRVNAGQLNVTADLSVAPFAEMSFLVLGFGALARVSENFPRAVINSALLLDVNRNCTPIGDNDFETFSVALSVGADMQLQTLAHFEIDAGGLPAELGFPTEYDNPFFNVNIPLLPTNGTQQPECFVIIGDSSSSSSSSSNSSQSNTTASATSGASPSATVQGVPASTGTLFSAAAAVPTWNFSKIESFLSASGHLPTNVNYSQMVTATTVPTQILQALSSSSSASVASASSAASAAQASGTGASSGSGSGTNTSSQNGTLRTLSLNPALSLLALLLVFAVF